MGAAKIFRQNLPKFYMKIFTSRIISFAVVAVIVFFVGTSLWGFLGAIRPPKIVSTVTPANLGLTYENVSFLTSDGLRLRGWFIPSATQPQAKTVVLLHGYPADKGDILPSLSFLHKTYNLFLLDFRYLGASEGKYSTAGAKEKEDLLAAIRFLKSRGIDELTVWGFSMGGAVALRVAAEAPEIKAIVSESSYARLDLMTKELYRLPGLRDFLGFLTRLWGILLLGIDVKTISPEAAARQLNIPILITHSVNDEVILFSHAKRLQAALVNNPRAEFWFREDLFHGEWGPEYQKKIVDFLARSW